MILRVPKDFASILKQPINGFFGQELLDLMVKGTPVDNFISGVRQSWNKDSISDALFSVDDKCLIKVSIPNECRPFLGFLRNEYGLTDNQAACFLLGRIRDGDWPESPSDADVEITEEQLKKLTGVNDLPQDVIDSLSKKIRKH